MTDLEWLMAVEPKPNGDATTSAFLHVRRLSAEESARCWAAEALLKVVTTGSALADLRAAHTELFAEIDRLEAIGVTSISAAEAGRRIQREFKAWLSAFKSFDDRTSAWLSRDYGKGSAVYQDFKRSLSNEFDTNFAYRLCCGLRNAAEHAGDVVNDMHFIGRENPRTGETEHEVAVRLKLPQLADRFPRIRSATREEMRRADEPLEVEWVVGAVALSCERVHCGLLISLWREVDGAAALIEELHREARNAGGVSGVFVPESSLEVVRERKRGQMNLRWNSHELAHLVRRNREEAEAVLSASSVPWQWRDFVAG